MAPVCSPPVPPRPARSARGTVTAGGAPVAGHRVSRRSAEWFGRRRRSGGRQRRDADSGRPPGSATVTRHRTRRGVHESARCARHQRDEHHAHRPAAADELPEPEPANVTITADSQNAASTSHDRERTAQRHRLLRPAVRPAADRGGRRDAKSGGAALTLGITQAANESANSNIVLHLGGSITPNVGADIPCLTGSGTGCTIGTATATSPLLPSVVLANGTVTLGGSATTPTITIAWGRRSRSRSTAR